MFFKNALQMLAKYKSYPNAVHILISFLKLLNIPVSPYTAQKELMSHPDYPSMLSVTDSLSSWNISNAVFKVNKAKLDFQHLKFPFIVHFPDNGGSFLLVKKFHNGILTCSKNSRENLKITISEFIQSWDGVILIAEKELDSGEKHYKQSIIKGLLEDIKLPFLVTVVILSVAYFINFQLANKIYLGILGLKILGIVVCSLLLVYSINSGNPFVRNLCSLGSKNGCNAILKSKASKITSWLNWSEVGMFYFAGSFLLLLIRPESIQFLIVLNILCLPYSFYSIGYQLRIKNWCVLCCCVQAILWAEAISFYFGMPLLVSNLSFNTSLLTPIAVSFLLPISIWVIIKPLLLSSVKSNYLEEYLKKFKNNSLIFNKLLTSQERYIIPEDLAPIKFGNIIASNTITIISNPYCGPCGQVHSKINDIVKQRDDIKMESIFATASHDNDARTHIARHLISLNLLGDMELVRNGLNEWYQVAHSGGYQQWAKKYPIDEDVRSNSIIEKQKDWCKNAEVKFTPTILINGYKLPTPYTIDDLPYLL
jgi:hypothetical protein